MYAKGLIYRGKRLVNWDPHFETAISDLEVENIEVAGHMWHFKYPLAGGATYRYVEKDAEGNVVVDEVRDYISIARRGPRRCWAMARWRCIRRMNAMRRLSGCCVRFRWAEGAPAADPDHHG